MLWQAEIDQFQTQGCLVVENLIDEDTIGAVQTEYSDLMDQLYAGWRAEGFAKQSPKGLSLWDKLDASQGRFRLVPTFPHQPPSQRHSYRHANAYRTCRL